MKAPLYNQEGEKKGEVTLAKSIFEVEPSSEMAHAYLLYQRANARMPIANVLTKGEVRGGGRKPYAQKHTGNARQGSIRNPHWKGGGRSFGPKKDQNYEKMMSKKMRRAALFSILSSKAADGKIAALDKFEMDKPQTKAFANFVEKVKFERKVLVVLNRAEDTLKKSVRNMAKVKVLVSGYLNPADLLTYDNVLFTQTALKDLETTYVK